MQITREKKFEEKLANSNLLPGALAARPWLPWLLAVASGVLQVLIFPLPNLTFLCWIAITPLLVAIVGGVTQTNVRRLRAVLAGFLLAYVSGIIFYGGSCYWVYHVMTLYGGLSAPVAAGVLVLFCLYVGLIHGLFGAILGFVASRPRWGTRALVFAPFFWVAAELTRARIIAFPWDLLGTTLVGNIPLTRIATVTGVYGLSFEILLVNAAFASVFLGRRRGRTLVLASCILLVGILETGTLFGPPSAPISGTARLVQENIPLDVNWTPQSYQQILSELSKLSVPQPGELMPGDPLPDIVIWPESPAPFFQNDSQLHQTLSGIAQSNRAYVLAGVIGSTGRGDSEQIFNSAELVAPNGDWLGRYDKIHLVPFGEYVPFQDLFSFAKKLTREVGNFVPGTERMVLPVDSFKLGTFICYESIFPNEVRQFAKNGAGLLVNISNDGWFGNSGAPEQHLRMARMRAIENHRWLLRSTNTGITASIDPFGRIISRARPGVRVAVDVPFGVVNGTTFYTRHGDWFAYFCAIITLVALFLRPPIPAPEK